VTTSRVDELVAGLTGVHDGQIAGPATPGARALLTAITAEERATATTSRTSRRLRRYRPFTVGAVAATALATTVIVGLSTSGPGPIRSYANATVDIQRADGTYTVHIKNVYADQRQFNEAFRKFGLDVSLLIVPVSPGRERKIVGGSADGEGTSTIATVLNCPPGHAVACPLTVELSGKAVRQGPIKIVIGRTARPGEAYQFQHPAAGDSPPSLRLTGRTVAEALARLHEQNTAAGYVIGQFHKDGSGSDYTPPSTWRPQGDRRVAGAWMHSSNSVTLLLAPAKGDPAPDPNAHNVPG
jgi:hypothetical protein